MISSDNAPYFTAVEIGSGTWLSPDLQRNYGEQLHCKLRSVVDMGCLTSTVLRARGIQDQPLAYIHEVAEEVVSSLAVSSLASVEDGGLFSGLSGGW